jgi:hypothetical protein
MFKNRHSDLGRLIAAKCRDFEFPPCSDFGVMEEDIFYDHIISSCPRGKFMIFRTVPAIIMFVSALCRGLYLVDSMSAFHPFSQVSSSYLIHTAGSMEQIGYSFILFQRPFKPSSSVMHIYLTRL